MALTDILQDIDTQRDKSIAELDSKLTQSLEWLNKDFENKKKKIDQEYAIKVQQKTASIKKKMVAQANMEKKTLILTAKRDSIDKTFSKTVDALSVSTHYTEIITRLLKKTDLKDGSILYAKGKKAETEKAIQASGKNFKLAKEASFQGGLIIVADTVELDLSFETLINSLREDIETDVAVKLFN